MMTTGKQMARDLRSLMDGLLTAVEGVGPLLQRDYWAVIDNASCSATELGARLVREFAYFAPDELVRFERTDGKDEPLETGVELEVQIKLAGACHVRVLHVDRNSVTLGTLKGHPEAGRITFGAYPNRRGDLIFHIRSRARSSSSVRYAGFLAVGEPMQTNTWTDFVDRVAHLVGDGVIGMIHAETTEIADETNEPEVCCSPTFEARGD